MWSKCAVRGSTDNTVWDRFVGHEGSPPLRLVNADPGLVPASQPSLHKDCVGFRKSCALALRK